MNIFAKDARLANAHRIQNIGRILMGLCASFSIVVSFGVLFSMIFESVMFFSKYPVFDFLFGARWSPQFEGIGGAAEKGAFGVLPLLVGTLVIVGVALAVAIPFGIFSAIYFCRIFQPQVSPICKTHIGNFGRYPHCCIWFLCNLGGCPAYSGIWRNYWSASCLRIRPNRWFGHGIYDYFHLYLVW